MNSKRHTHSGSQKRGESQLARAPTTKLITAASLRNLGLLVIAVAAALLTNFYTAANVEAPSKEILLEFIPMHSPVVTNVQVSRQGNADALRYIRSRLLAVEALKGNLSTQVTSRLFATADTTAFKDALHRQSFAGTGLTQGDQFRLIVVIEGGAAREIFGFVHLTPKVVSSEIVQMLAAVKNLDHATLAAAYLKGEPIPKERFARLQTSGLVKEFGALPSRLRQTLQSAIDKPYTFVALDDARYQHFLSYKTSSELLLDKQGNGYQIKLFTTNTHNTV